MPMSQEYNPAEIETAAQQWWHEQQTFRAVEDSTKEKYYCLAMFPYPSGQLQIGHVRNQPLRDVTSPN